MADFPIVLSNVVDGDPPTGTEILAKFINNLEAKVGIDGSAVTTSLDYLLKNAASIDPGHKHSKLWASDGSPEAVTVDAGGNVGIGTTPKEKLTVYAGALSVSRNESSKTIMAYGDQTGLGVISGLSDADWFMTGGLNNNFVIGTRGNNAGEGFKVGLFEGSIFTPKFIIESISGNIGIGTTSPIISGTGKLHMAADTFRLDTARTPASAGAAGNVGEICWDASYLYICIATNSWKRAAIAAW